MLSDATSFEGAPDTCRDMRGRSLYRLQKVGKKLAGFGNGAYLCTIKNTITTKKYHYDNKKESGKAGAHHIERSGNPVDYSLAEFKFIYE